MRGKKAPPLKKAEAVGLALTVGIMDASKQTGIPARTLRRWKDDPELAELGLSAREDVAEAMWIGIQVGLDQLYHGLLDPTEGLKAKADTVFGMIDKHQLLTGQATTRTELRDIGELDHDEKRRLRERFAAYVRTDRGGDPGDGVAAASGEGSAAS